MPRFNFTFQEASPLISYTGSWREGTTEDQMASSYDGSFRLTDSQNAKATINFNGTGMTLFGAFRPNHGNYTVSPDYSVPFTANGSKADAFRQPLWKAYNLSLGVHTVEVTNEPSSSSNNFFDLDFVSIERTIGQDSDTIFNTTLDDTSPFVQYSEGSWAPSSTMAAQNYNSTVYQTTAVNTSLAITFQGCSIELYGLYANAAYTVGVDNGPRQAMQGMDIDLDQTMWHPQTLLYLVDGLAEDTNHTVTVTTTETSMERPFFFDYATVRSTQNIANRFSVPSNVSETTGSSAQSSHSSSPTLAFILGLSFGGAVILALVVAAYILLRRRRSASSRVDSIVGIEPYMTAEPPRPWITMGHARPATEPSTFQLSSVVPGWRRLSGDEQTSSGSLQSPQDRQSRTWDSFGVSVPRRSVVAHSARPGKRRQLGVANSSSARFSQQSYGVSEARSPEEDAGPMIDRTSRVPPAYNPAWGESTS